MTGLDQPEDGENATGFVPDADLREFVTERETTVTYSPGEPVVRLWTSVAKHLRAFRADPAYREVRTWPAESSKGIVEAASFEIRRDLYDPARGRRRLRGPKEKPGEMFPGTQEALDALTIRPGVSL